MADQLIDRQLGKQATLQSAAVATGNGTAIDMLGYDDITVQVVHASTPTLTVTFEGSVDGGTTYFSLALVSCTDHTTTAATDASAGSVKTTGYTLPANKWVPLTNFRCRVSAYTAGNVTVTAYRRTRAR